MADHAPEPYGQQPGVALAQPQPRRKKRRTADLPADDRPLIQIRGGGLAEHADDAQTALAEACAAAPMTGVYARGSMLVRPVRLRDSREAGGLRQPAGAMQIFPVDADYLRLELTRLVQLQKFDKRLDDWVNVDAPDALGRSVLAAAPWPRMLKLNGIIEAPTLRPDGSPLDKPGYDRRTGLLFDPGSSTFDPLNPRPSREDAETALATIHDVLAGFPFSDAASKSVAVSSIITGIVRRTLRSAPMFGFTAPKMASGKTLLATVASYIVSGRSPAMLSQADNSESERKLLLSLLMEGSPVVVIDNIERTLASATLCSILTEPVFSDRILGSNRTVAVPTNAMFIATGNNLTIGGDLSTRALVCSLDPACERPEEREFDVNLHQVVPARRGELVAAALTIPMAYLAAGAPALDLPPFGRFEAWAKWCRNPLVWLGEADPCASRRQIESRDPVREQLSALLQAWYGAFGVVGQTVAAAIGLTNNDDLREAISAVAQQGRDINSRKLGNFISAHENRIEGGLRFTRAGERQGVVKWVASTA